MQCRRSSAFSVSGPWPSRVPRRLPGLGATSEVAWPAWRCTLLLGVPERDSPGQLGVFGKSYCVGLFGGVGFLVFFFF